ncbi:MAG: hypothetical protein GY788_01290 [bacterium]|nr:hypothetical protein [bacterium]
MRLGVLGILALLVLFAILHLGLSQSEAGMRVTMATLIGGTAFLLMTTSIVLSTRPALLESAFGGLDRLYQVHKVCGVVAGLFVLLHFFAAPKEMPVEFAALAAELSPSAQLGMIAMIGLILSLAIALNRKIPYHRWRLPHKAMGVVYALIIGHFMTAPSVFVDRFGPSGLLLMVAAVIGVVGYLYSIFGMNRQTGSRYSIEAVNHLERATELVLKPAEQMMTFKPGQFAFVEVQDAGFKEPHPFTISSAPSEDRVRFTMKVLGDWTRKVREELQPGGDVVVRGPYGRFDCAAAGDKQVWLAGGIGVTPFLSTLRHMQPGDRRDITFVYAVREKAEAAFLDEITRKAEELGNVKVVVLESNEGQFARVDVMKEKLAGVLNDYDFFLCGPKPMVNGITKDLRKEGVPTKKIHTEAFEFR